MFEEVRRSRLACCPRALNDTSIRPASSRRQLAHVSARFVPCDHVSLYTHTLELNQVLATVPLPLSPKTVPVGVYEVRKRVCGNTRDAHRWPIPATMDCIELVRPRGSNDTRY